MVIIGLVLAFALGFFNLPWWTAFLTAFVVLVGTYRVDPQRTDRATRGGNLLLLLWGAIPCIGLWWLGSLL